MKQKINILFIVVLLLFVLGCGKKEKIGYYSYSSCDDYVSSAGEYSNANNIYIEGKLIGTDIIEMDGAPYIVAYVKEAQDKTWICKIGQAGRYSDEEIAWYIGKKVKCFGDYKAKKDGMPILELEKTGDNCIWLANGKENICDEEQLICNDLLSSANYRESPQTFI